MKKTLTFAAAMAVAALFAANFFTPGMMKRNGLTDEQYQLLWSMGRNPQIEAGAAREWVFRASRYDNVVDWLETIGKTNDFARLAARVPGLTETNRVLTATNVVLAASVASWRGQYENAYAGWTNSYAMATNYYAQSVTFSNRWSVAESVAQAKSKLVQDEIDRLTEEKADLEEKIASATYVVLRPWLRLKLAAVEAAIKKLEGED